MNNIKEFYTQGQIDFFMKWLDFKYTTNTNENLICQLLNIPSNELKIILDYYQRWKYIEHFRECGRANVIKSFIKRHEFLSLEQQATLLNISPEQLDYYLSYTDNLFSQ